MRAILLAGGLGTRLKPLTNDTPKCLMKIGKKPLLEIWLDILTDSGIESFLINTHYLHKQVEEFVDKSKYKNKIILVHEPNLLGTAGTLIKNSSFFNGDAGMLIHADNYSMENIRLFMSAHRNRPKGCLMTMMLFHTNNPKECGVVELDSNGIVVEFYEKVESPPSSLASGAIYILSSEIINKINNDYIAMNDFSTEIVPNFMGKIFAFETKKTFIDIGTVENYYFANSLCNE
jgi:mannose-1-phosphate guanylyltransferase